MRRCKAQRAALLAEPTSIDVPRQMVRGSLWMVGLRWALRGIGLVSTITLARLLTPRDFGVVAIAMLLVGALETVSDTGQKLALIRHPQPSRAHYDSAWTMSVLIGCGLAAVITAAAPLSLDYFHEPDAVSVIRWLALRALLGGLENPGVADFRRTLNFSLDFRYAVAQKLGAFVITLAAAIVLRNYWALVIGIVASRAFGIVLSYILHPHRPRPDLSAVRDLWSFSFWILADNIAFYLVGKVDQTVVGGIAGAGAMGRYSVASDVASSPVQEIAYPATHAQFPVIARVQNDPERAREGFLGLLGAVAAICAAAGTGVSLIAHDFTGVVLGQQWIGIAPLMPWIALEAAAFHTVNPATVFFQVTGRPQLAARMTWLRLAALVVVLPLAGRSGSLEVIAAARFATTLALAPVMLAVLSRAYAIPIGRLAGALWRPIAAAAAMAVCVLFVQSAVAPWPALLRLTLSVAAGGGAFSAAMLGLWTLAGRPSGLEAAAASYSLRAVRCALRGFAARPVPPA